MNVSEFNLGSVGVDDLAYRRTYLILQPRRDKTGFRGFRPGPTHKVKTVIHRRRLEARNVRFIKKMHCTIYGAKTTDLRL